MKIRTDFVTNSSSSSFVIAYKGEIKEEELKPIIARYKKSILEILYNEGDYLDLEDELKNALAEGDEEQILNFAIEELASDLYYMLKDCDCDLKPWKVQSIYVTSDSSDFLEVFLYENGSILEDNLKLYDSGM